MTQVRGLQQTSPGNFWWVGLQTIVGAVIATLVVRATAMAILDIPAAFPPLAGPGPTLFFTVVGVLGGVGVLAAVCRVASQPIRLFRIIVAVALLVSFVPDILLLTSDAFPGTTVASVSTLMFQHVVAAAIVAWMLTMQGRRERAAA